MLKIWIRWYAFILCSFIPLEAFPLIYESSLKDEYFQQYLNLVFPSYSEETSSLNCPYDSAPNLLKNISLHLTHHTVIPLDLLRCLRHINWLSHEKSLIRFHTLHDDDRWILVIKEVLLLRHEYPSAARYLEMWRLRYNSLEFPLQFIHKKHPIKQNTLFIPHSFREELKWRPIDWFESIRASESTPTLIPPLQILEALLPILKKANQLTIGISPEQWNDLMAKWQEYYPLSQTIQKEKNDHPISHQRRQQLLQPFRNALEP